MWFAAIAAVIIGGLLLYKLFFSRPNNFWRKHEIPEVDTSAAIGKLDILLGRKAMTDADDYAYAKMGPSDKFCGLIEMGQPLLMVKDLEIIKKLLIKDFDHFVDRRPFFSEDDGSLKHMLLSLQGDEWKGVRSSVSPTFTTGKIRRMMDYFNLVGKEWVEEFTHKAEVNGGSVNIDVLKAVNLYTVEVISRTVFAMNAGVIKDPDSAFAKMANKIGDFNKIAIMKFAFRMAFPRLGSWLGLSIVDRESLSFFESILDQGLKARMNGAVKGNDFLQLLVDAKKGELRASQEDELSSFEREAMINTNTLQKKQYLTEEIMNAQSVLFFFAGFNTTSNFITFALYSLALFPKVQDKLRKEVEKVVKEDGSLDYDDVGQLLYLDMVVSEVLRKFPAGYRLERLCIRDYKDPEEGLVIPKGAIVAIPANAIHHDKRYYDNPDEFDPEHFAPEKKAERSPYAFMPFGIAPRNCIGMRFAQIEVKSALAHMVHNFVIEPTPKTPVPLHGVPVGLNLLPPKNLELKLTPIGKK